MLIILFAGLAIIFLVLWLVGQTREESYAKLVNEIHGLNDTMNRIAYKLPSPQEATGKESKEDSDVPEPESSRPVTIDSVRAALRFNGISPNSAESCESDTLAFSYRGRNYRLKHLTLFLMALCVIGCQNKPVEPAQKGSAADTVDIDAAIVVERQWYPEDRIVHLFGTPTAQQVAAWKDACDRDTLHEVDRLELSRYAYGLRQLTAFYDVNGLDFGVPEEDAFILWRLAQFTGDSIAPSTVEARLDLFLQQIGKLLEFEAEFQFEMNMLACMDGYLQDCFNRIAMRQVAQDRSPELAGFIHQDSDLSKKYREAYTESFNIVTYDTVWPGSAYPMALGGSASSDAMIVRFALNAWAYPDSTRLLGTDSRYATNSRVLAEYDAFIAGLEESEYLLPVAQRREALLKEKSAWEQWMALRANISPQLPEPLRSAFNHATRAMCRRKLITLKNRYECFGIMGDDYYESLLSFDCTDEQLASYRSQ